MSTAPMAMRSSGSVWGRPQQPPVPADQASHSSQVPWGSVRASALFAISDENEARRARVRGKAREDSRSLVRQPHGTKVVDGIGKGAAFG